MNRAPFMTTVSRSSKLTLVPVSYTHLDVYKRQANLFAWRTRYSDELRLADDPFGKDNRKAIETIAARSIENGVPIICAWGCRGAFHGGDKSALDIIRGVVPGAILKCLGKTKAGHPRHPLYLRRDQSFEAFP